jgi:hypothetical protein
MTSLEAAKRYVAIIELCCGEEFIPNDADRQWFRELVSAEFYDGQVAIPMCGPCGEVGR